MLKKLREGWKSLESGDKSLLGVALFVLINYQFAFIVAVFVVGYFAGRLLGPIIREWLKL